MVIEIFFTMIHANKNINGINIFGKVFKLTSYADDTTFFIEKLESIKEIFKTFDTFSKYSGLKINKAKCEVAGIGIKRG